MLMKRWPNRVLERRRIRGGKGANFDIRDLLSWTLDQARDTHRLLEMPIKVMNSQDMTQADQVAIGKAIVDRAGKDDTWVMSNTAGWTFAAATRELPETCAKLVDVHKLRAVSRGVSRERELSPEGTSSAGHRGRGWRQARAQATAGLIGTRELALLEARYRLAAAASGSQMGCSGGGAAQADGGRGVSRRRRQRRPRPSEGRSGPPPNATTTRSALPADGPRPRRIGDIVEHPEQSKSFLHHHHHQQQQHHHQNHHRESAADSMAVTSDDGGNQGSDCDDEEVDGTGGGGGSFAPPAIVLQLPPRELDGGWGTAATAVAGAAGAVYGIENGVPVKRGAARGGREDTAGRAAGAAQQRPRQHLAERATRTQPRKPAAAADAAAAARSRRGLSPRPYSAATERSAAIKLARSDHGSCGSGSGSASSSSSGGGSPSCSRSRRRRKMVAGSNGVSDRVLRGQNVFPQPLLIRTGRLRRADQGGPKHDAAGRRGEEGARERGTVGRGVRAVALHQGLVITDELRKELLNPMAHRFKLLRGGR